MIHYCILTCARIASQKGEHANPQILFHNPKHMPWLGLLAQIYSISMSPSAVLYSGRRVGLIWAAKGGSVQAVDTNREAAENALRWIQDQLPARSKAVKGTPGQVSIETDTQKAVQHS